MAVEEKTCRLCYGDEDDGPLVQPCACRGSAQWIHKHCLEQWRRKSAKEDAAYRCGQCMNHYHDALSIELLSARRERQAKSTNGRRRTAHALASELYAQCEYDEAEKLLYEVLEGDCKAYGRQHPITVNSIGNLVLLLKAKGDRATAEPLLRDLVKVQREFFGNRHPNTLACINSLGRLLHAKGDLAAAEPLCREALEVERETLGNRHPYTLTSIGNLGGLLQAKGDLAAAELLIR